MNTVQQERSPVLEGSVVGGYTVTERLATGGMGVLWRASASDGSAVAVKVLRAPLADQGHFRRRFAREAQALTRLHGPHTPRVLAADPDAPTPYLVLEYVSGPTVEERLKTTGPLVLDELLDLAQGLAHALAEVRGAGLVHRDVKPNNVILSERGPVLIDFGIVAPSAAAPLTSAGVVMGSPGWTAPELMTGQRATAAADVFGWAGVLAYAASGRNPYGAGPTFAVMDRIRYSEPDLTPVPEPLVPVLRRAMSADPADRPDAHELLAMLDDAAAGAHRPPAGQRLAPRIRARAVTAGTAVAIVLAASGGLALLGAGF